MVGGLGKAAVRRSGPELRAHGEKEALRLFEAGWKELGLPPEGGKLRKSDPRKVVLAMVIRERTDVGNLWIAERLAMGHPTSVSRLITAGKADRRRLGEKNELRRKLDAG